MKKLIIILSALFSLTTYGVTFNFVKGNDLVSTDKIQLHWRVEQGNRCHSKADAKNKRDLTCIVEETTSKAISADVFAERFSMLLDDISSIEIIKRFEITINGQIPPSCLNLQNQFIKSKDTTITVYKNSCVVS